jgi:uncharacterized membrane protein YidH (DUF202 family)
MAFLEFLLKNGPTLVLENKGATARDHLANERTFLAYLRTSLSLLTVGIAVTQLFRMNHDTNLNHTGKIIGLSFGVLSIIFCKNNLLTLAFFSLWRYFYTQRLLQSAIFPASRGLVGVSGILIVLVTVVSVILTFIQ